MYHYVDSALDGHEEYDLDVFEGGHETSQLSLDIWPSPFGGGPSGSTTLHHRQRDNNEYALAAEAKERAHLEGRLFQ